MFNCVTHPLSPTLDKFVQDWKCDKVTELCDESSDPQSLQSLLATGEILANVSAVDLGVIMVREHGQRGVLAASGAVFEPGLEDGRTVFIRPRARLEHEHSVWVCSSDGG